MKPFDDMIPEEMNPKHKELLALLHHVYRKPAPVPSLEQQEIIKSVREDLLHLSESSAGEDVPLQHSAMKAAVRSSQPSLPPIVHRRVRLLHLLNTLAAVLVIGAIIVASLLLFTHRPQLNGTQLARPISTPVTVHSQARGLEISMSITPGPYFLSEMLAADISLTNHTHTTFSVGVPFVESQCGYTPGIVMNGGDAPYYVIPIATQHSCPGIYNRISLRPGQIITVHKYLPLTASGQVTLTTEVSLLITTIDAHGNQISTSASNPLNGHWPSIQINVHSVVPADRKLSFRREGPHIIVISPLGAQSHLVYLYGIWCQDSQNSGITSSGNYGWEPLSTNEVNEPSCPARNLHWQVAFGSPGYAITSGSYTSSS